MCLWEYKKVHYEIQNAIKICIYIIYGEQNGFMFKLYVHRKSGDMIECQHIRTRVCIHRCSILNVRIQLDDIIHAGTQLDEN